MASSQHVEMEAAKLLHKLIQESKDEPAKLATKLYVVCSSTDNAEGHEKSKNLYQLASYFMLMFQICQHMKLSGKEQSLPYQVISRCVFISSLFLETRK
jgi:hypothetical protein